MSTRTPRRSEGHDVSPGLIVSKLGFHAVAEGDLALGLLCLKVTIPRDLDPRQQSRWGLFGGDRPPPKLRSIPALYPLSAVPTLLGSHKPPQRLAAAVALLSLKPSAYPPVAPISQSQRPVVDVSATTGQVYVVMEEGSSPPRRTAPAAASPSSPAPAARSEWLIILEVELPIHVVTGPSGTDELFKVSSALPRCLDNTIDFRVVPRHELRTEVEILSNPKVRTNPASAAVRRRVRRSSVQSGIEDGWEDGEVPGVIDALSDDDSDYEGRSSALDGRFQSTDVIQLEWRFAPSLGSPSDLRVLPQWDTHRPLISMSFEATLPVTLGPVVLESVLPPGWGWSELEIRGDGLVSWRSTDGEGWIVLESASTADPDESTATIDALQTPQRQTGLPPGLDSDDFSFELNSFGASPSPRKPVTPGRRRPLTSERSAPALHRVVPRSPTVATVFQLEFEALDGDIDDRIIYFLGSIVPLNLTLVSPGAPVQIPFVRFDDLSFPTQCTVTCPHASFTTIESERDADSSAAPQLCNTTLPSVGVFNWVQDGQPIPTPSPVTIPGPVQVNIQRNVWAVQTVTTGFAWPAHAAEVGVRFPGSSVRVIRATSNDTHLPRAVLPLPDGRGTEVRVGRGRGSVELVVEVVSDDAVAVPSFSHGKGDLLVELAGREWDNLLSNVTTTNLEEVSYGAYRGSLERPASIHLAKPSPPIVPKPDPPAKASWSARIVSLSTLFYLALFFILISLAIEVQRLRAEVAFVADEARDLRLYGLHRAEATSTSRDIFDMPTEVPEPPIWEKPRIPVRPDPPADDTATVEQPAAVTTTTPPSPPLQETSTASAPPATVSAYPIGRVVKPTSWGAWTQHPAIQTITSSVAWLWSAFAWLLLPG